MCLQAVLEPPKSQAGLQRMGMFFQASCTSDDAHPTQSTHQERCSLSEIHRTWQIEGFFFSTPMHLHANAYGDVLRHGFLARHSPGSRAGISQTAANPAHRQGHSRVLAKPPCFLLVRLRVCCFGFFFLVPQNQQYLKRAH